MLDGELGFVLDLVMLIKEGGWEYGVCFLVRGWVIGVE